MSILVNKKTRVICQGITENRASSPTVCAGEGFGWRRLEIAHSYTYTV